MNEIKFGLQSSNIMMYLTSSTCGVTWAATHPENSNFQCDPRVCQPNTNSFSDIN